MAGPIGNTASTVSLTALAKVETLTTKCSLVDFAVVHSTERHANVLQLTNNNMQHTLKQY